MKRILIVEDEILLQEVYQLILQAHGYEVTVANNGLEGLKKLESIQPDLILLDIFMPVMDGKEFLRNYDDKKYPAAKVIVYTNLSDSTTESEMRGLGAHEFVLKASMTPQALADLVGSLLTV
jgi:CheY-like chemotaxis protein